MKILNINNFVASYLATAAWVTCDSDECDEFTKEAKETAKNDCQLFINACHKEFGSIKANELLTIAGNDLEYLTAHNFFLTRNHHGAGFWDSENIYGIDEAKKLTEISDLLGQADVYHVRGKKSKLSF
jgi:hypothetical protein